MSKRRKSILFLFVVLLYIASAEESESQRNNTETTRKKASFSNLRKTVKKQINAKDEKESQWSGRHFPDKENDPTPPPKVLPTENTSTTEENVAMKKPMKPGAVPMGVNTGCDNGKEDLKVDWDDSPVNYTCYANQNIRPNTSILPVLTEVPMSKDYVAQHICMDSSISYKEILPTYGPHRPVWPSYGEYKFIPRQRWLHSLEHGAIVMLYHPCADKGEVDRLRRLVTNCLRRYIISPFNLIDEERPLVLLAWRFRLEMSFVTEAAVDFIKENAHNGPEVIIRDGRFKHTLIKAPWQNDDQGEVLDSCRLNYSDAETNHM